ncbi:MAG: M20/M25/M40 family metallo-hydrolase [Myxococcota bacterium]
MNRFAFLALLVLSACATAPEPTVLPAPPKAATVVRLAEETHLTELHQLTFEGENAEAYWRFDGTGVSLQRRSGDVQCDRIYTMKLFEDGKRIESPVLSLVSSGKGATTCAHYLTGDRELVYASTHLGGDACPPKPDMKQGYVWALYDSYDIFRANEDGSGLTRLTDTPGYDAEATVCAKDGSIVFTSVRDGDLELYRMDRDGKNVKRLTFTPGYDGGAFFNADCSKLVWRASRPQPGKELEDFQALLKQGLVRPSKLELYVANADGSDAHQVTYLNAASFAPFFTPDGKRILFSSNHGDPKGREFDLWAVNVDGTDLERITYTKGFDGFPMFSPDGKWLLFASNRMTPEGQADTNLFLARWDAHAPRAVTRGAPERLRDDAAWLSDPAREGRGVGTKGLDAAGEWIEARFKALGLEPAGADGFRAPFEVTTAVKAGPATSLKVQGKVADAADFTALGFSAQSKVKGAAVLVGYGLQDQELGLDDYKGLNVKGKVVVVRRFTPEHEKLATPEAQRKAGDLRKKAFTAKQAGAAAVVVVDWPVPSKEPTGAGAGSHGAAAHGTGAAPGPASGGAAGGVVTSAPGSGTSAKTGPQLPREAPLPVLRTEGVGDAGLPVVVVKRSVLEPVWKKLEAKQRVDVELQVALDFEKSNAFNVVGRIPAGKKSGDGVVVIGAHYDHLGLGGPDSLAPDKKEPHLGADDNASGTVALLEIARSLAQQRDALTQDVIIVAFSAEEGGVRGSTALIASKPAWLAKAVAMLNLDMVGRLRNNTLSVLGSDTAPEWMDLVQSACAEARVLCKASGDGYGPSDHMPFYTAGLPVLHFFTGAHSDYHKPSDSADKLNDAGLARVAQVVVGLAVRAQGAKLTYTKIPAPAGRGDARSFNASLGTVPDYGGPPPGVWGVLLSDVRPGGGADLAGMRRGDVLQKLGTFEIRSVEDLMFVLMQAKPGETVTAIVLRDGKPVALETTYQEGRRR